MSGSLCGTRYSNCSAALNLTTVVMSFPYFVLLYRFIYSGTRNSNCFGAFDLISFVMSFPDFFLLYCFIQSGTRDSNCYGARNLISVSCGSFCSFMFCAVFALLLSYSQRPSAHKIRTIMCTLCAPLFLSINRRHKYVQKYVILTNFQYKHSKHATPVKSVAGQIRISLYFPTNFRNKREN